MEIRSLTPRKPSRSGVEHISGAGLPKLPPTVKDARWAGMKKKRRRASRKGHNLVFIRTVTLAVVALGGLMIALFGAFMHDRKPEENPWIRASVPVTKPPAAAKHSREFPLPSAKEVESLVRKVLRMRKAEEFRDSIRLKDMSETEAVAFLARYHELEGGVENVSLAVPLNANGIQMQTAVVSAKKEGSVLRIALLTPDSSGAWQFDLAAFAGHGSVDWEEFSAAAEGEAQVRVKILTSTYYNGIFNEEPAWSCFELLHPGSDRRMVGYCPKGSAVDRALQRILNDFQGLRPQDKGAPVIVQIKKTAAGEKRQCEILSVAAENWILTDTPYDEGLQEEPPP